MATPSRAYVLRRLKRRRVRIHGQPPGATQNAEFTYTPDIRGGLGPYTLAVTGGALPTGLAIDGETITGTPTVLGTTSVFVKVTDANGVFSETVLDFAVVPA
jgi:hypothetical protein